VVTAIAAPAALKVQFSGGGGHAGALLMPDRCLAGLNKAPGWLCEAALDHHSNLSVFLQ
jgi:hypothetical protein